MEQSVKQSYYSVREIADMLGVSHTQVYRLIYAGTLTAIRLGPRTRRVHKDELARFLAEASEHE